MIRRRAGLGGDLDGLEIVQVLQPPFGAIDQRLVVGIAFGDVEFAPDHVIAGTGVAVDIDALDIGPRPLIDLQRHIDAPRFGIAGGAGHGLRKGIAELGHFGRDRPRWSCRARCRRTPHRCATSNSRRSFSGSIPGTLQTMLMSPK